MTRGHPEYLNSTFEEYIKDQILLLQEGARKLETSHHVRQGCSLSPTVSNI